MTTNKLLESIELKIRNFNFMTCRLRVNDDDLGGIVHYERESAENIHTMNHIGLDTIALFLIVPFVLFPYGIAVYAGFALEIPLFIVFH